MIVIADTNIIISAIYSPEGIVSKILLSKNKIQFLAPDYVIDEMKKHLHTIALSLELPSKTVKSRLTSILSVIKIISTEKISKTNFQKAVDIVKDIDIDDAPFVVLHLHTKHKIWTGDNKLIKGLKKKGYFICITTVELKRNLYKK